MTLKVNLKAEMGIVELYCAWPLTKPDLQNLKSSQPCRWGFKSSGMWRCANWWGVPIVSKTVVQSMKKFFLVCLTLKMKALWFFKMPGSTHEQHSVTSLNTSVLKTGLYNML